MVAGLTAGSGRFGRGAGRRTIAVDGARALGWLDDQYAEEGGDFVAGQRDLIGWKAAQPSWVLESTSPR